MREKTSPLLALLVLSWLVSACGADCESLCEDRKHCGDASPDEIQRDCRTSCKDEAALENRFGCGNQRDDLDTCLGGLKDLCDPSPDACSSEQAKLYECNRRYCSTHLDDTGCGG